MRKLQVNNNRAGFTLIEMLVVILIIVILVGLVSAAVLKYLDLGPQLQTTNEIQQLTVAVEAFKTKYKVYPPSSFLLSNTASDYSGNAYGSALYAIWPRINVANVNWGNGGTKIILEGDQCLVFFLFGPSGTGWSTNPSNPTASGGTRVGPFFEFPANRLVSFPHAGTSQPYPTPYFSFVDPYSTPIKFNVYAFFSSGRNSTYSADCPSLGSPLSGPVPVGPFSYGLPAASVNPYVQTTGRYYNPNTVQIISAGKNLVFGNPGGAFVPGNYPSGSAGFDDLSNFASGFLGVP